MLVLICEISVSTAIEMTPLPYFAAGLAGFNINTAKNAGGFTLLGIAKVRYRYLYCDVSMSWL